MTHVDCGCCRIYFKILKQCFPFQITPKTYSYDKCDRVTVYCSPWRAMRILGENFGYTLTVTPLSGRVEGPTGERRTEVWTMVSAKKAKINQV